jgi:hypothetical protein
VWGEGEIAALFCSLLDCVLSSCNKTSYCCGVQGMAVPGVLVFAGLRNKLSRHR